MVRKLIRTGPSPAIAYSLIAALTLCLLLLGGYVVRQAEQRVTQIQQVEAVGMLSQKRAELESRINSVLYLSSTLSTYIAVNPQEDMQRWYDISKEIVKEAPLVRNIGLAPDNVIRFVFPLSGNEKALGLDYRKVSSQWPAVERAMKTGEMTLAGPVNLVQGGRGLIGRTPIFTLDGADSRYWGLSSVVIDYDGLLESVGLAEQVGEFNIAIRGKDGAGEQGELFFGHEDTFSDALAKLEVYFPDGSWVIAASQATDSRMSLVWLRALSWALPLFLCLALIIMYQLYRFALTQSLTDSLTGCDNRRSLMHKMEQLAALHPRTGQGFALLFIDLNHFKEVNDTHGHHVGDELLRQAAERLRMQVRQSDSLARNGGDEFILLLPSMGGEGAGKLAGKFEALMAEPFKIDDIEITISASVGYAIFPTEVQTADELMNLADARMYERKREKKALEAAGEKEEVIAES